MYAPVYRDTNFFSNLGKAEIHFLKLLKGSVKLRELGVVTRWNKFETSALKIMEWYFSPLFTLTLKGENLMLLKLALLIEKYI